MNILLYILVAIKRIYAVFVSGQCSQQQQYLPEASESFVMAVKLGQDHGRMKMTLCHVSPILLRTKKHGGKAISMMVRGSVRRSDAPFFWTSSLLRQRLTRFRNVSCFLYAPILGGRPRRYLVRKLWSGPLCNMNTCFQAKLLRAKVQNTVCAVGVYI